MIIAYTDCILHLVLQFMVSLHGTGLWFLTVFEKNIIYLSLFAENVHKTLMFKHASKHVINIKDLLISKHNSAKTTFVVYINLYLYLLYLVNISL